MPTRCGAAVAQRLGRDRGVVEVAGAAEAGRRRVVAGRPAERVGEPRAPPATRSAACSAQSTAARAASQVPGPDQRHRVVGEPAGVGVHRHRRPGRQPGGHRRGREQVGHHPVLADQVGVRARGPARRPRCAGTRAARGRARRRAARRRLRRRLDRAGGRGATARRGSRRPGRPPRCPRSGRRPRPRAAGRAAGSRGDQTHRDGVLTHGSVSDLLRQDGRMPRARDLGIAIGTLPTGPDQLGARRRRASASATPRSPRRHRHATGVTLPVSLAEDAYPRPRRRRRRGAQRRRGVHRLPHRRRSRGCSRRRSTSPRPCSSAASTTPRASSSSTGTPSVADDVVIPVVAECDDSFLNDCRPDAGRPPDDVRAAHDAALASRGSPAAAGRGRGRARAPACPAWASRAASVRRRGSRPAATPSRVLLMTNFGQRDRLTVDGVPVGRLLARRTSDPPKPAGLLHRRRRHRRPRRRARLRAAGPPGRARPGPDRLDRPPRQRRDLPGREHRPRAPTATGPSLDDGRGSAGAGSTTCSRRSSTPPRSRCSTRC